MAAPESEVGALPLGGVKVLDFTENVAGPFATMILGDLGAEVIKIERVGRGDVCRAWGPFWGGSREQGCYFMDVNRNKESVAIDLKSSEGASLSRALAARCDVIVENFRPGVLDRLGLGYEDLKRGNPGLVFCSISAYGEDGPRKDQPGFDPTIQALTGMMTTSGFEDSPPFRVGPSVIDKGSGMWAAISVLAALRQRAVTGVGQRVCVSLLATALSWMSYEIVGYLGTGVLPKRLGSGAPGSVPSQVFRTQDGYIHLAVANDRIWRRLCAAVGLPELADDARFARNEDRLEHREDLPALLQERILTETSAVWLARLEEHGVPSAPINTVREAIEDAQVLHLKLVHAEHTPDGGGYAYVASPATFCAVQRRPPSLGQDTVAVLEREVGLSREEIDALISAHVVQ